MKKFTIKYDVNLINSVAVESRDEAWTYSVLLMSNRSNCFYYIIAMRKIRRNGIRREGGGKDNEKKERRSRIDNDDNNGINLVALDRFPCWRERGLR